MRRPTTRGDRSGPSPRVARDEVPGAGSATCVARHRPRPATPLDLLVVGRSASTVCGVRDHAGVLTAALESTGVTTRTVWSDAGVGPSAGLALLADEVGRQCRRRRPDAMLLHYSVFSFAHRGVPLAVPAFARRLRRLDVPVVVLAHEFAYPWRRRGGRGAIHALTQRAALVPLVAASSALIVTSPQYARFLRSRRWLPARPTTVAPVLPTIAATEGPAREVPGRVGVFSFGSDGLAVELTVEAVAAAAGRVPGAHLVLIGSPGPTGVVADRWRQAAHRVGCRLTFTGIGTPAEVSAHLRSAQVIVLPDEGGPSAKKTSLAVALAHGRPVVALSGAYTWPDLVAAGAVELVAPTREALAGRIASLLSDSARRAALGRAAVAFHRSTLAPERVAASVGATIRQAAGMTTLEAGVAGGGRG